MTFSLYSHVYSGEGNTARLFINGVEVDESEHFTYSETGMVWSTGGREMTREVSQGDNIELRTTRMSGYYGNINYCAEYVPNM